MNFKKSIKSLIKLLSDSEIFTGAAAMGFYIITSFFPFLCMVFITSAVLSLNVKELYNSVIHFFPTYVSQVITDVLGNLPAEKTVIVLLGFISLWTMSGALMTATKIMNKLYGITEKRNFIILRLNAAFYALLFIVLILATMAMSVFGKTIACAVENLLPGHTFTRLWNGSRSIFLVAIVLFFLTCFYRYIPGIKQKFSSVFPGAVFAMAVWLVYSRLFAIYVDNFSKYHILYGSIAGVIILVTWIYLTSFVILTGCAVNVVYGRIKNLQKSKIF